MALRLPTCWRTWGPTGAARKPAAPPGAPATAEVRGPLFTNIHMKRLPPAGGSPADVDSCRQERVPSGRAWRRQETVLLLVPA